MSNSKQASALEKNNNINSNDIASPSNSLNLTKSAQKMIDILNNLSNFNSEIRKELFEGVNQGSFPKNANISISKNSSNSR
jgi:hypothetical protein